MKKKQKHYSGKELLYHRALERQKQKKKQRKGIPAQSLQSRLEIMNSLKEPAARARHWQLKGVKNGGNTNIHSKMHDCNDNDSNQSGTDSNCEGNI